MLRVKIHKITIVVNILFIIFFFSSRAFALDPELPSFLPRAFIPVYSARGEEMGYEDLLDLSLLVSGVAEKDLPSYREKILSQVPGLKEFLLTFEGETGEGVLIFLHDRFLKRYFEDQTRLDLLLDRGGYNCVSSAVLYLVLARSVGLEVVGVKTTSHAFCRVVTGEGGVDVETTNPHGYNPGTKKEFTDSFGKVTGFSYTPPGNYREREEVPPRELISLILQNLVSQEDRRRNYPGAFAYALDLWYLEQSDAARDVLISGINNMNAYYGRMKEYDRGVVFLDRALEVFGADEKLLSDRYKSTYNYLVTLSGQGRFDEAETFLESRRSFLSPPEQGELAQVILKEKVNVLVRKKQYKEGWDLMETALTLYPGEKWLLVQRGSFASGYISGMAAGGDWDKAVETADQAMAGGVIGKKEWLDLSVYICQLKGDALSREKGWLEAAAYIQGAMEKLGRDRRLQNFYNAYTRNYEVEVHNQFVKFFNRGEKAAAQRILEEGLNNYPDSALLKRDLKLLER